jgi:hypothetical protein
MNEQTKKVVQPSALEPMTNAVASEKCSTAANGICNLAEVAAKANAKLQFNITAALQQRSKMDAQRQFKVGMALNLIANAEPSDDALGYCKIIASAALRQLLETEAEPVQSAERGEPVSLLKLYDTIIHWDEGGGKRSRRELALRIAGLYTTQPAQPPVPLTETEFEVLHWKAKGYVRTGLMYVVRMVEAHHGITAAPTGDKLTPIQKKEPK